MSAVWLLVSGVASAGPARSVERGPWLLTALPGMGTISWGCDLHRQGYRAYTLRFDAAESTATETVTLRVGVPGKVVLSRVIDSGRVAFPRTDTPFRQIEVSQGTEPGTLRAVVKLDFRGRPVSPSHCWPYLPPAMTVRLFPR